MSSPLMIPPIPDNLLAIQKLMAEPEPDVSAVSEIIKEDIALYTLFLSAANSPWMGLVQPATNVEHAIMLMGLDRIYTMVQAMMVRTAFIGIDLKETFWSAAIDVAGVCSDFANRFSGLDRNQAYSIGMLHNAGIAIMMNQFEEFKNFIKTHEHLSSSQLCVHEKELFGTDHYLQGALMAKQWHLGEEVTLAIRCQPLTERILTGKKKVNENVCTYLAILALAKNVSAEFRRYWLIDENHAHANHEMEMALSYMQINLGDFNEIKEDLLDDYNLKVAAQG